MASLGCCSDGNGNTDGSNKKRKRQQRNPVFSPMSEGNVVITVPTYSNTKQNKKSIHKNK